MTTIVCYDDSIKEERKFVTLSVRDINKNRFTRKTHVKIITRTNGIVTETLNVNDFGLRTRKTKPCAEEDRYDYEHDIRNNYKHNDLLMKDANNAFNLLLRKGYLCRIAGITGWVRQLSQSTAKIVINTEYSSEVISALLELYFPNRRWEVV